MQTQTPVEKKTFVTQQTNRLPFALFLAMASAIFLIDAVLPLPGLRFPDAALARFDSWLLLPSRILFPGQVVNSSYHVTISAAALPSFIALSWEHFFFLFASFLILFLLYLLALRVLPSRTTHRFVLYSTLLLGVLFVVTPTIPSQDLFSYIGYARMEVIYHLNPLTTAPTAIQTDPVYQHIYWGQQPSVYGPTWIFVVSLLQWLAVAFGFKSVWVMVFALRLFSLGLHLFSTQLIWLISGRLQRVHNIISPRLRMQATLAFAWNPLLLFESGVNAHNDIMILALVLLAFWLLVSVRRVTLQAGIGATVVFALATCLKVNFALLVPGLLLFLWVQQSSISRRVVTVVTAVVAYVGTIALLYVPFWLQGGKAIFHVFQINPGDYRDISTLFEVVSRLYISIKNAHGAHIVSDISTGSSVEVFTHQISLTLFVIVYAYLCIQALYASRRTTYTLSSVIRWMTVIWLLYCAIGSPWFWPWYMITFFGLFALVEATNPESRGIPFLFGVLRLPLAVRILAFSILCIYCSVAWAPFVTFLPGFPDFRVAYLRGLWVWLLPLLALHWHPHLRSVQLNTVSAKTIASQGVDP